jgi:hypothetical protein
MAKKRIPKGEPKKKGPKVAGILGVGLDNEDGHKRITRTEEMTIVGGSEETHGKMQDTAIYFSEKLEKKGKKVTDLSPQEAMDFLQEAKDRANR